MALLLLGQLHRVPVRLEAVEQECGEIDGTRACVFWKDGSPL